MTELKVVQDGKVLASLQVEAEEKHGLVYCYSQDGELVLVVDTSKDDQ